jgi:hypothetical protein
VHLLLFSACKILFALEPAVHVLQTLKKLMEPPVMMAMNAPRLMPAKVVNALELDNVYVVMELFKQVLVNNVMLEH